MGLRRHGCTGNETLYPFLVIVTFLSLPLSQFPLGILTSCSFAQGQVGNVIVWTSIILGQPIALLMYLHDYYWLHWSSNTTPSASTINLV